MRVILGVALLAAFVVPLAASAEPSELSVRVVWTRGSRAYVAARDSGVLAPGLALTFLDRRRVVATGAIDGMLDGTLASVRLGTGSLERIKRIDRLRVLAEPFERRAWPVLRVGCPRGSRENLVVDCASASIEFPFAPDLYRVEPFGEDAWRGVRQPATGTREAWPETLVVRLFADAIDEEIALERGELDIAVFWPGEPSARLRGGPLRFGTRASSVIAVERAGLHAGLARLASANAELFGGDLELLADTLAFEIADASGVVPPGFAVDLSLPGHTRIEHFLNGGATLFLRGKPAPLRVTRIENRAATGDSLAGEPARRWLPFFAIRAPIAGSAAALDYLDALDAGAFADLVRCTPREARP